jgi:hypothetical protein
MGNGTGRSDAPCAFARLEKINAPQRHIFAKSAYIKVYLLNLNNEQTSHYHIIALTIYSQRMGTEGLDQSRLS